MPCPPTVACDVLGFEPIQSVIGDDKNDRANHARKKITFKTHSRLHTILAPGPAKGPGAYLGPLVLSLSIDYGQVV